MWRFAGRCSPTVEAWPACSPPWSQQMTPPAAPGMMAGSFSVAAAKERLRLSGALRPARVSGSCTRGLCDSWRNCLAAPAGCGRDGSVDERPTRRGSAPRRHRSGLRERSRPADLCGILAAQGKTAGTRAQALFSTGWNESTLLILSESFESGGVLRIREEWDRELRRLYLR